MAVAEKTGEITRTMSRLRKRAMSLNSSTRRKRKKKSQLMINWSRRQKLPNLKISP
jgi:hypothetical protein